MGHKWFSCKLVSFGVEEEIIKSYVLERSRSIFVTIDEGSVVSRSKFEETCNAMGLNSFRTFEHVELSKVDHGFLF